MQPDGLGQLGGEATDGLLHRQHLLSARGQHAGGALARLGRARARFGARHAHLAARVALGGADPTVAVDDLVLDDLHQPGAEVLLALVGVLVLLLDRAAAGRLHQVQALLARAQDRAHATSDHRLGRGQVLLEQLLHDEIAASRRNLDSALGLGLHGGRRTTAHEACDSTRGGKRVAAASLSPVWNGTRGRACPANPGFFPAGRK